MSFFTVTTTCTLYCVHSIVQDPQISFSNRSSFRLPTNSECGRLGSHSHVPTVTVVSDFGHPPTPGKVVSVIVRTSKIEILHYRRSYTDRPDPSPRGVSLVVTLMVSHGLRFNVVCLMCHDDLRVVISTKSLKVWEGPGPRASRAGLPT